MEPRIDTHPQRRTAWSGKWGIGTAIVVVACAIVTVGILAFNWEPQPWSTLVATAAFIWLFLATVATRRG